MNEHLYLHAIYLILYHFQWDVFVFMEDQLYTHCLYGKHGHIKESQQSNLRLIDTYKCNYLKRQCQCIEMCPAYKGLLRDGNKKWGRLALIFLQFSNWIAHWIAESILAGLNVLCCFGCWKVSSYDLVQLGPDVAQPIRWIIEPSSLSEPVKQTQSPESFLAQKPRLARANLQ